MHFATSTILQPLTGLLDLIELLASESNEYATATACTSVLLSVNICRTHIWYAIVYRLTNVYFATASNAFLNIGGSSLPRRFALRRIPPQAFGLK